MRKRTAVIVAILASVAVTSLLWAAFVVALRHSYATHRMSDIVAPMRIVIADLNETARKGEHDLLRRKLEALADRWEAFGMGKDRPDGFWTSIVEIDQ